MCDERTSAAFGELEDRIAQLEATLRKHGQAVVKQCGITTLAACGGSGDAFHPDDVPGLVEDCISLVVRRLADVERDAETIRKTLSSVVDERDAAIKRAEAAVREADRLRHGVPIEGDFVCPDSLALTEALALNAKLVEALNEAADWIDLQVMPTTVEGVGKLKMVHRCNAALDAAGKGVGK